MKIIDLSVTLDNDAAWAPWWARTRVKRQSHAFGMFAIWLTQGLSSRFMKTGTGWANDHISLSTHGTTHLDAPWHYGPLSEGKPARTIDQVPLEWCFSDGVRLDLSHKQHGDSIEISDLEQALIKIDYRIKPLDIVLIRTGSDRLLGTRDYFDHGPGVSAAATRWLLDQGVKVTGIDAWGWDRPLPLQAQEAKASGRNDLFWAAHLVGIDQEYCHMERLCGLDQLPGHGFKVACFPLKVKGGSAGPARVVAIFEEGRVTL